MLRKNKNTELHAVYLYNGIEEFIINLKNCSQGPIGSQKKLDQIEYIYTKKKSSLLRTDV